MIKSLKISSLLLLVLLTSCQPHLLDVQTQYLTHENLASFYVNTPDPARNDPDIGERLMIRWSIPSDYLCYDNLSLHLRVRFKDREEEEKILALTRKSGTYLYCVINETFCRTGGILTYKIDLIGGGCILETWRHPLWSELILFDNPEKGH